MKYKIAKIEAAEILDSRGNPTVECYVTLDNGVSNFVGWAAVPSGASTGKYEAVELRDEEDRYMGKGVINAVKNVNEIISKELVGKEIENQREIDEIMIKLDGTENKSKLGANAILSVSMAFSRAMAKSQNIELFEYIATFNDLSGYILPIPMMNIMNGGAHGNWASDIQEYMIIPIGADSIQIAVRMCAEVYQSLKSILKEKKYSTALGDEGGFAPQFESNEEPFLLAVQAIHKAGYDTDKDFKLGIDVAASEFFENTQLEGGGQGRYILKKENKELSTDELLNFYESLIGKYPIISIEDGFAEDDWEGFKKFEQKFAKTPKGKNSSLKTVGDDLYVTNISRLERGIKEKSTNSILIKLNQIGTVSETIDTILLARENGMDSIVSHRSGETEDSFIADLAVGMGTGWIKTGAPARGERTAKYNRLMRIERMIPTPKYGN